MQVKTITTAAGVNEIDFGNDNSQSTAHFYWLKNLGDSTLYVSANPDPIAEEDDVAELPAKGAVSVETDEGKVYILGAGKVEIHRTNSKFCPFEWQSSGSGGGGGGSITVDSELSDTSTNPLQNKVTTAAIKEVNSVLETKSDINHIHDISASGNPVQMDGLQEGVPFSEMVVSGKNLLILSKSTLTANGITATANDDGSITLSGTATAITYIGMWDFLYARNMGVGKIAINAIDGQSISTYFMGIDRREGGSYIDRIAESITNNGIGEITQEDVENDRYLFVWVRIAAGYTCDNLIIYPQLELGSTPTAYEPPITGRELTVNVSGKNLLPAMSNSVTRNGITYTVNADGTITLNGTAEKADGVDVAFKIPLKAGVYTLSGCPKGGSATSFALRAGLGTANTLYGRDYGNGLKITTETDTVITVTIQNAEIGRVFDNVVFRPQLELGATVTPYAPYHGSTTTITPTSNPYIIPNDIRQQEGYNVISVSAGELSVVGVQKNAAIKRIWDDMRMDLLFDGVTSADNPAVVNLANYNMIRIDVSGNYAGTTYFNCGSTYLSKSTLDFAFESYGRAMIPASNQTVVINISKSGAEYSLSFSGFNEKQLVDVIKIYGIK